MASITLAQAGGAGTAAENASLETAWQGLPITATLSDEGAGAVYAHELLEDSPSDGLSVAVTNAAARVATFTPSGGSGSFLLRSTVTDAAGAQTVFVRVVRVTKDAAGATLDGGLVKPAFGEEPGHSTVDARGAAGVYDRNVDEFAKHLPVDRGFSLVDLSGDDYRQEYDGDGSDYCRLGLASASGFRPGCVVETFIPAASALGLRVADNLDPNGDRETFDAAKGYYAIAQATSETTLEFSGRVAPALTAAAPTVTAAEVLTSALDVLVLTLSEACQIPRVNGVDVVSGITLGGTMAVARTVTGVSSGNGTTSIALQLSGALDTGDTPTVVLSGSTSLRAMNGTRASAGTTSIDFVAPDYDVSALTGASWWLRADTGIGVADGAAVATWTGKNPPNAATATQASGTNQPTFDASDATNLRPGVVFDGVNDYMSAPVHTTADMFGAASASFCVVAAVKIDAVDSTTGDSYDNDTLIADAGYWGMFLTHEGGTYRLVCLVYTSGAVVTYATKSFGASLPAGGYCVLSMRLSGGNLYAGINGAEGTPVACTGTLNAASDTLHPRLGCNTSVNKFFDGTIFELFTKANGSAPTDAIAAFVGKYVP